MYAHIDRNEANRIRHHFRVYLPGNPDIVEASDLYATESIPIVVSWSENPPKSDTTGYLLFDFDETGVPPLHVVATGDGLDFDGHTYSRILGEQVGLLLKEDENAEPGKSYGRMLTLYIDNEISYD